MKCDIEHQLISFSGSDCPMCRLKDAAFDMLAQFEQVLCEFEELVAPSNKPNKAKIVTKAKSKPAGKLLRFPRSAQMTPDGAA